MPRDSACVCCPTGTTHTVSELVLPASPPAWATHLPVPSHQMGCQVGQRGRWDQDLQRACLLPELFHGSSCGLCTAPPPGLPGASAAFSIDAPELVVTFPPGLGSRPFPQQAFHLLQFLSSTPPSSLFLDHKPLHGIRASFLPPSPSHRQEDRLPSIRATVSLGAADAWPPDRVSQVTFNKLAVTTELSPGESTSSGGEG